MGIASPMNALFCYAPIPMSDTHLTETLFSSFDLPAELQQGLDSAGFKYCTPIQEQSLPIALAGQDVAGQAQTGTGKTAAFLLAVMSLLMRKHASGKRKPNQPRALILAPTRELAIQIHRDAELFGKFTGLKLALAYGGTGFETQKQTIEEGCDILIGTPGRIIDYFKRHVFDLHEIQAVVLDEADRMFDLGFIKDIRFLLRRTPKPEKRLGMLFSATLSHRVMELAYDHMNQPEEVVIEAETMTADKVTQIVYHTANDEKIPLLLGLMKSMEPGRSIVFTNTKRAAERVWGFLESNGIGAGILSGDVPQTKRQSLLADFTEGRLSVLVATDVAARGLHVPGVSHVFNFDLPDNSEDYVHRIGRTARAGESGDAISFACETYAFNLMDIEEYIGHKLPVGHVDSSMLFTDLKPMVRIERKSRPDHRGGKPGGRGKPSSGRGGSHRPRR